MVVIGGCVIVIVAVLTGFSMAGGHASALMHASEFVTIGGASIGALIVMSPKKVLGDLFRAVVQLIKGSPYNRATYFELFGLLAEISRIVRRDGLLALEPIVNDPHNSALLMKYPRIQKNHHACEFLCGGLSLFLEGVTDADHVTRELDKEIRVIEQEHHAAVSVLAKTADALPGFGIVAAVLGIVVTMQAIDGPASEIGHKVAAALVGTFLGILLSYGFFAPMAARMEIQGQTESTFFRSISTALASLVAGENARDVIGRARRIIGTECRPSLVEMQEIAKASGKAA